MFDTMEIARKIKQSRIDKNMTQMQLADAMGVSYQAVSNWERGNSMPDISKLADLCSTLGITVDALLGVEQPATAAVTKAMEKEELSMEELAEVAPMLPPEEVKERVEAKRRIVGPDMGFLKDISENIKKSFRDARTKQLTEKMAELKKQASDMRNEYAQGQNTQPEEKTERQTKSKKKQLNLSAIADLAPFLDAQYLDELVMEAAQSGDLDGLDDLAPFLSQETLHKLVEMAQEDSLDILADLAPFLSKDTLDMLAHKCVDSGDFSLLEDIVPFLSKDTLDSLAEHCLRKGDTEQLEELYPFLSQETLRKIANHLAKSQEYDALKDLADYM